MAQPDFTTTSSDNFVDALRHNNSSSNDSNSEMYRIRKPKRTLHFSDGTLEEYDSDSDCEDGQSSHNKNENDASQLSSVDPVRFLAFFVELFIKLQYSY